MVKTLFSVQPYFSIQYELLEAAQLAIETMNGTILEGSCIRVRWPKLKTAPSSRQGLQQPVSRDILEMPRHETV